MKKFATKSANKVILWKLIESLEVVVLSENLSLNFDNSSIAFFCKIPAHLWVIPLKDIPKETGFLHTPFASKLCTYLQFVNYKIVMCKFIGKTFSQNIERLVIEKKSIES